MIIVCPSEVGFVVSVGDGRRLMMWGNGIAGESHVFDHVLEQINV